MDEDDRRLRELHAGSPEWLEMTIQKMQRDVEHGNALQRLIRAERIAANKDLNELERTDGNYSERQGRH
jgi:hypothetical protein